MGSRHAYAKNGMIVAFFGTGMGVLDCDWWTKNLNIGESFRFSVLATRLFANQCVPSLAIKDIVCSIA